MRNDAMMRLRGEICVIALNIEVAEGDEVDVTSCVMGGCEEWRVEKNAWSFTIFLIAKQ